MVRIISISIIVLIWGGSPVKKSTINESSNTGYPEVQVTSELKKIFTDSLLTGNRLSIFYSRTNFTPVWLSEKNTLDGISLLKQSVNHGLIPERYNIDLLDSLSVMSYADSLKEIKRLVVLDTTLSAGIIQFLTHLNQGILNPIDYHKSWNFSK